MTTPNAVRNLMLALFVLVVIFDVCSAFKMPQVSVWALVIMDLFVHVHRVKSDHSSVIVGSK